MEHDCAADWNRVHLERLKLAADVLLSEAEAIPAPLEAELIIFRERVERSLLLPAKEEANATTTQ